MIKRKIKKNFNIAKQEIKKLNPNKYNISHIIKKLQTIKTQYEQEYIKKSKVNKEKIEFKPLMKDLGSNKKKLIIGFDTEYHYPDILKDLDKNDLNDNILYKILGATVPEIFKNICLSYQFYICGIDDNFLITDEYTLYINTYKTGKKTLNKLLTMIFTEIDISKYSAFFFVVQYGKADLGELKDFRETFNGQYFSGFQNPKKSGFTGSFSIFSDNIFKLTYIIPKPKQHLFKGDTFKLNIRDLYALTDESLSALGKSIGLNKIDNPYRGEDMLKLYQKDYDFFKEYGMRDAEITAKYFLKFIKQLSEFGLLDRGKIPVTAASIASSALKSELMKIKSSELKNLGYIIKRKEDFNEITKRTYKSNQLTAIDIEEEFIEAYIGGRNEAFVCGMIPSDEAVIYDYDFVSAYASAMLTINQWDFENYEEIYNADIIYKKLCENPDQLALLKIEFEFKDNVAFPGIPVRLDNGILFPKKGKATILANTFLACYKDFKYCRIIKGLLFPFIKKENIVSEFILDCLKKRNKFEKNTVNNKIYKLIINSLYGKMGQGLSDSKGKYPDINNSYFENGKYHYSSNKKHRGNISNAILAAYITDCVRACGYEYLNYIHNKYFNWEKKQLIVNFTTDGFMLSNIKLDDIELRGVGIVSKRMFIKLNQSLNKDHLLEIKHLGKGVLSLKVRCYTMITEDDDPNNKIISSATGLSLKNLNNKEKATFIVENYTERNRFQQTRFEIKRIASLLDMLIKDWGCINITDQQSFNFDYDFKRQRDSNYSNDLIYQDKKFIQFYTKPMISLEEYLKNRRYYQDYKKGEIKKNNKAYMNKLIVTEDYKDFEKYSFSRDINKEFGGQRVAVNSLNKIAASIIYL